MTHLRIIPAIDRSKKYTVPCPKCLAPKGHYCVNLYKGKHMNIPHIERKVT
jgi:hypothetical protein